MRQYSTTLRDSWNNTYESVIGPSPRLQIYDGTIPVNTDAPAISNLLIEMSLPPDWLLNSSGGLIQKVGVWSGITLVSGVASFYRIIDQMGTCHEQGTIGEEGSGSDLSMNLLAVELGQSVSVNSWSITAPGA